MPKINLSKLRVGEQARRCGVSAPNESRPARAQSQATISSFFSPRTKIPSKVGAVEEMSKKKKVGDVVLIVSPELWISHGLALLRSLFK